MRAVRKILPLVFCVLFSGAALAQPIGEANQSSDRIIQQLEQRRIDEQIEQNFQREQKALRSDLRQPEVQPEQAGACVDVQKITLSGISILSLSEFTGLLSQYEGRCLYIHEINALTQEITNLYIERGYITSRAYITQQDLSDGTLEILVVEGKLEGIKYKDGRADNNSKRELEAAFGNDVGEVLNLRDFEQGIDQMNRLKSNKVTMELTPGAAAGGSVVLIENSPTKRWHARMGLDNTGLENTGEEQAFIELDYDNILSLNDLISVSFKHDINGPSRRKSRNATARIEVPYHYWNFAYSLSYFDYISEISSGVSDFKTSGFSRVHDFDIQRVIHRDQDSKTNFSFGLTARENENFIEEVKLSSSSQKLTVLDAGISHSRKIHQGFAYGAVTYHRGIDALGAQSDNALGFGEPQSEFESVTADINVIKYWDVGFKDFIPRTDFKARGQWSRDQLYGSQSISIGGPFSVRGFKEASLGGDTGAYAQLNLSVPLNLSFDNPKLDDAIGEIRPFIGFDTGVVRGDNADPTEGGTLRSWTVGVKNEGGAFNFELAYSRGISSPVFLDKESHDFYFRVSRSFKGYGVPLCVYESADNKLSEISYALY